MKGIDNLRVHPLLGLVLLSIVLTGCPPPVEDDPNQNNTVTDIEGNIYKTVTIGTQVWMAENLKSTKCKDGTTIPLISDNAAWGNLTTPGYCWYNNDMGNKIVYGALYNWFTVNTGKLCPTGWHVPSDTEWTLLSDFVGGYNVAGGKLKETGITHWKSPNSGATNETGFTALPGGSRDIYGTFSNVGDYSRWWSTTVFTMESSWYRGMHYTSIYIDIGSSRNKDGFYVRCLKD